MYIPRQFRNDDIPAIEAFIRQNAFAQLVSTSNGIPLISHIPIEIAVNKSGVKVLHGHLARGNPQWKSFTEHPVLAVFQGAHSYISPSWYNHVNVPTWNYIAVHITGKIRLIDDDELYHSLIELVNKYEAGMAHPVTVEGMSDYVRQQMKGIVGFEIAMDIIEGKWKLSQNRDEEDFQNIIKELEHLKDENAKRIAEEMKRLKKT